MEEKKKKSVGSSEIQKPKVSSTLKALLGILGVVVVAGFGLFAYYYWLNIPVVAKTEKVVAPIENLKVAVTRDFSIEASPVRTLMIT